MIVPIPKKITRVPPCAGRLKFNLHSINTICEILTEDVRILQGKPVSISFDKNTMD